LKKDSAKPGKQRAKIREGSFTKRHKTLSGRLSSSLSETYGRRSVPIRRGDTVQVQRGDYSEITGKVLKVDYARGRINIEGATREKVDGRPTVAWIHPSKVVVTKLDLGDKLRARSLERGRATPQAGERIAATGGGQSR